MGTLYIVGTPIGNLKDITLRALEILKGVDLILAEDTRVTKKLLSYYGISKPLKRYDENVGRAIYSEVRERLQKGQNIVLVTDAGTPSISDPGSRLVAFIRQELPDVKIVPIPGPSALTAALSVAGVNADQFTFFGYPPHKKGRQKFFKELKDTEIRPIVLYESPHRIVKTLDNLAEVFGQNYKIVVCRELTKVYEEIFMGTVENALEHFRGERQRGEFVLIIL